MSIFSFSLPFDQYRYNLCDNLLRLQIRQANGKPSKRKEENGVNVDVKSTMNNDSDGASRDLGYNKHLRWPGDDIQSVQLFPCLLVENSWLTIWRMNNLGRLHLELSYKSAYLLQLLDHRFQRLPLRLLLPSWYV